MTSRNTPETAPVTESAFYMWRAIFSMAHADEIVTAEERRFMLNILNTVNFTPDQQAVLERDIETAADAIEMFRNISDPKDRSQFFYFARLLMWSDGDFGAQEQQIMTRLSRKHFRTVDFAGMVGNAGLELEEEQKEWLAEDIAVLDNPRSLVQRVFKRFQRA